MTNYFIDQVYLVIPKGNLDTIELKLNNNPILLDKIIDKEKRLGFRF